MFRGASMPLLIYPYFRLSVSGNPDKLFGIPDDKPSALPAVFHRFTPWIKTIVTTTVASSSWVDRMTVGERIGNPALDQSFIEAVTDPSGKKKWAKHLADRRSREISPGTQVKVIGRERNFSQIRVEGEESEWWVLEEDLERIE
jgi:hypothetical protein